MTLQTPTRWYPYLCDAVAVRRGAVTLTGYACKSDDSMVEVGSPLPDLAPGLVVDTAWRVGEQVRRSDGVVAELLPGGGFTVRLGEPVATISRRVHPRSPLVLPLAVEPLRAGSLAPVVASRTVDVSRGGLRAGLADGDVRVGDLVALDVFLGSAREEVYGRVMWQDWPTFGRAVAGVRFEREVDVEEWYARLAG